MTVLGKKITWKALNPVMHSFVTITANRPAISDSDTCGRIKKQAPEGACHKHVTDRSNDQNTNSLALAKPGSGLIDALKKTFSEKAPRSFMKTVARAAWP